jgi:hypothetical protein
MTVATALSHIPLFALLLVSSSALSQTSKISSGSDFSSNNVVAQQGGSAIPQLQTRPAGAPKAPATVPLAPNGKSLAIVNGLPYLRPSQHDTFVDYARDTYGLPALLRTSIRAGYAQARDLPTQWTQDWPGFGDRFGSSAGITIISGNVRYGMEEAFHEDLRYIACHGCKVKAKISNALLAEITARHDTDGHRFFTLTPTVADFSGPILSHTLWYPGPRQGPLAGVVSARTYFATRVGSHLFREFVIGHYHRHPTLEPDTPHQRP